VKKDRRNAPKSTKKKKGGNNTKNNTHPAGLSVDSHTRGKREYTEGSMTQSEGAQDCRAEKKDHTLGVKVMGVPLVG